MEPEVIFIRKFIVKASNSLVNKSHILTLSNLDLLSGRFPVTYFYFYPNKKPHANINITESLKSSLAKTLNIYYPFVTRLLCGGFIFALRMNHTICDSYGLGQFLIAVAELAQGATQPTIPPVWERHILDARDPPHVTCKHLEYGDENAESHTGSVIASPEQPDLVQICLYFGPKELTAARAHLSPTLTCSTFELITGCVWKCRTISFELDPEEVVRVSMVVNARGKKKNVSLPVGFYGNALGIPGVVTTAGLLCEQPLDYAVELVKEAKGKMNTEYFRSCADLMAIRGWVGLTLAGNNLVVSDNTRTGVVEVDFGWGKPVIAGPAKSVKLVTFYVRDNSQEDQYGILVPICLPFSCVQRFEQEMKNLVEMPK